MPMKAPVDPTLRDRMPSEPVTGGISRIILNHEFGEGSPMFAAVAVNPDSESDGLYQFHEGDLFSPGAGNWVFEPNFELPMVTIWGNAFLRRANTFKVLQPPQVWSNPTVTNAGLGGLQAGTIELTPLSFEDSGA